MDYVFSLRFIAIIFFCILPGCVRPYDPVRDDMQNVPVDFAKFKEEGDGLFSCQIDVPWLGDSTDILIVTEEDSIPDKLKEVIQFAVNQPLSTKDRMEAALLRHYQNEIYGMWEGGDDITPPINSVSELRKHISSPTLKSPYEHWIDDSHYFVVTFECTWNPESGLAVLFNSDGQVVDVGVQGSF